MYILHCCLAPNFNQNFFYNLIMWDRVSTLDWVLLLIAYDTILHRSQGAKVGERPGSRCPAQILTDDTWLRLLPVDVLGVRHLSSFSTHAPRSGRHKTATKSHIYAHTHFTGGRDSAVPRAGGCNTCLAPGADNPRYAIGMMKSLSFELLIGCLCILFLC